MVSLRKRVVKYWDSYKEQKIGVIGLLIISAIVFMTAFAPWLSPFDPYAIHFESLLGPNGENLLGTDLLGRDILSRIIWGAQASVVFGISAASFSAFFGVTLGAIAGYLGGLADDLLSRICEIFLMIPSIILIIIAVAFFGGNFWIAVAIVGITLWPQNFRLMRAQALGLRRRGFVLASVAAGASNLRVIFRHILPNGIHPVLANVTLQVGQAILLEAALGFLGLSDPNIVSWGKLLYVGQITPSAWWIALFPGLVLFLCIFGFNVVGGEVSRIIHIQELKEAQ